MIRRFGLCRRPVADDLQQTPVIEPVDPFQGGELNRLQASPGPRGRITSVFVKPDDRLGQGVRIAYVAHRLLDPGLGQAFGVADGQIMRSAITVMDQAVTPAHRALVQRLLEGIEREIGT